MITIDSCAKDIIEQHEFAEEKISMLDLVKMMLRKANRQSNEWGIFFRNNIDAICCRVAEIGKENG